jgi:hypothetical protein
MSTVNNPFFQTTRHTSYAMRFTGVGGTTGANVVETNSTDFFDVGTGDFTLMYWGKTTRTSGNNIALIFGHVSQPGVWIGENNGLRLEIGNTGTFITAPVQIGNTGFRHVAVTRQAGTVRFVLDGVQVHSATFAHNIAPLAGSMWRLGGNGGSGSRYSGDVAFPRAFKRSMTDAEILALMNSEQASTDASLSDEWPLREGKGTTTRSTKGIVGDIRSPATWAQRLVAGEKFLAIRVWDESQQMYVGKLLVSGTRVPDTPDNNPVPINE